MSGRGGGRGRSRAGADYLDFDWDEPLTGSGSVDDLADSKHYDDFLRQERVTMRRSYNSGYSGYSGYGRRRTSMPRYNDRWGDRYDDDDYDDYDDYDDGPPARMTEKRYLNGKHVVTNMEITAQLLRLIGPQKEQLGPKSLEEALRMAIDQDMDLILINPEQTPPVARLIQWSKYKFELEQGVKERKAKSSTQETKEVRLKPKTDDNDLAVKARKASQFLGKGNKVKITMRFEGRQLQFKEQGKEVLLRFIDAIGDAGKVEGPLTFRSGSYSCMLVPMSQGGGGGGGGGSKKDKRAKQKQAPAQAEGQQNVQAPSGSPPPLPPKPQGAPPGPPAGSPPPLPPRPQGAPPGPPAGSPPPLPPRPQGAPSGPPAGSPPPLPPRPQGAPPAMRPPPLPNRPTAAPPPLPTRPAASPPMSPPVRPGMPARPGQ